jgi:hypothetical protein
MRRWGIQSTNSAHEWRAFMMKISFARSVLHRHGYKVTIIGAGVWRTCFSSKVYVGLDVFSNIFNNCVWCIVDS